MFNYDKLIFGFKKRVQVQLTIDNLGKKKVTIIVFIGMVLLVTFAGLVLFKPWQSKSSTITKPVEQIPKPTQADPQTNPFEVKTNPFKDIKTNPFR